MEKDRTAARQPTKSVEFITIMADSIMLAAEFAVLSFLVLILII